VKEKLSGTPAGEATLLGLIKESAEALGIDKAVLYVSPKDTNTVKTLVKGDRELAQKIEEVREHDCLGGVIVEDIDGRNRIDNSYDARLEQLLLRISPDISKELFRTG
jgi:vacuolar-type H+-ATPase subunit E/Vma4